MKNKNILFSLTLALVLSSLMFVSSAGINSLGFNTLNYSEHDTNTPAISITVTGNSSAYLVTFYVRNQTNSESVIVAESGFQVLNATATNITLNDISFATSRSFLYNVTAYNDTNNLFDGSGATGNLSNGTIGSVLEINQQPSIQSVVKRGNNVINAIVPLYKNMTWTVNWTDVNSTSNDSLRLYSCKTNSFSNGCSSASNTWAISPLENDGNTLANYTITAQDTAGSKNFYLFLLDDNGWASAVSSGTFTVIRGGSSIEEIEASNNPPAPEKPEKKKSPIVPILIIGGIVLGYLMFRKK